MEVPVYTRVALLLNELYANGPFIAIGDARTRYWSRVPLPVRKLCGWGASRFC